MMKTEGVAIGVILLVVWLGIISLTSSETKATSVEFTTEPSWLLGVSLDGEPEGFYMIVAGVPLWMPVEVGDSADVRLLQSHVENGTWNVHNVKSQCEPEVTHVKDD